MGKFVRFRLILLVLGSILAFFGKNYGQNRLFHKITVEDGLSQSSVLSFAQDKKGFMWIGTSSGLNRYDSRSFNILKQQAGNPRSISGNNISCLLSDTKDRLWVGTTNNLNLYNRLTGQFKHFLLLPGNHTGQNNNLIRCIYEDQQHQIWVGTQKGLFVLQDNPNATFKEFVLNKKGNAAATSDVRTIVEDFRGDLWIGTTDKVLRISNNFSDQLVKEYDIAIAGKSAEDLIPTSLAEDENHTIWLGTMGSGVLQCTEGGQKFEVVASASLARSRLPHDYVRKIHATRKGSIWVGTQQGLCEIEIASKKIITYQHDPAAKYSLSQNSIYDIFTDQTGNLWVGTYYGGINISYAKNTPFTVVQATGKPEGLGSNVVSSIYNENGKGLWIGTDAGGISFKNNRTGNYQHYRNNVSDPNSLGSNLVKCIFKDSDDNIWVGTHGGGLNLLNQNRKGFTRFKRNGSSTSINSNDIMSIAQDAFGKLWLATENNGLSCLDKKTKKIISYHPDSIGERNLQSKFLRSLLIDRTGNIWVASEIGLLYKKLGDTRFNPYNYTFKSGLRIPEGEPVRTLYEDSRKKIWIGTATQGIYTLQPGNNNLVHHSVKSGLPSNNIKGMIEDLEGNMWITTDNGLCKFDQHTNSFIAFNVYDGLPGNDFTNNSFFRNKEGKIYVGSLNGLIQFEPKTIEKNDEKNNIAFISLQVGSELINPISHPDILKGNISEVDQIKLSHDDNVFTVAFSLLNFIKPNKNQYLYKLDGFESDWKLTNNGSVTYTNLPAGTYNLLVKAANNDGIWNEKYSSITIIVSPPFWNTWWAYFIYLLLSGSVILFVTRYFWMREKYRQQQLLQQYKIDFFTNISHEIRTQLTLIATPLKAITQNELPEGMRKTQLSNVQKHTQKLTDLVNEMLDFRKAETGTMSLQLEPIQLGAFISDIADQYQSIALERGIQLQYNIRKLDLQVRADALQISKVINNLMSNALKFTDQGNTVGIELKQKENEAIIRVWDNGIGIDPKYFTNLFNNFFQVNDERSKNTGYGIGLALSKSIIELHGGIIEVSSKVRKQGHGGFTVFTIKLPALKSQNTSAVLAKEEPVVLVVEDNNDLRKFIVDALKPNYAIIEASDGKEGLEIAFESIPDLIISDIMMPVMDGLELCTLIKKEKNTSHIPIILLTAKATIDDKIKGLEYKADAYITKPFDLRLLMTQVNNLLDNRSLLQEKFRNHYLQVETTVSKNTTVIESDPFLQKMVDQIQLEFENTEFSVATLAKKMAVSQPVLYRKVHALTGLSVNEFIKSLRMKKASELLSTKAHNVSEVAYMVGFTDRKYFSKEFKKYFGKNPSNFE